MEIKLHEITIGEIANGFADNNEEGVVAYGGKTTNGASFFLTPFIAVN